jgi:hypothetical protein
MDGNNIAFALQLLERNCTLSEVILTLCSRGVIKKHSAPHTFQSLYDAAPYVAYTYDSHGAIRKINFSIFG